jgi:hypothetical protein
MKSDFKDFQAAMNDELLLEATPLGAWLRLDAAQTGQLLRMAADAERTRDRVFANMDTVHLAVPVAEG